MLSAGPPMIFGVITYHAETLTIFETKDKDSLYQFNAGWLYNSQVEDTFRKKVDRELVALRINGAVRAHISLCTLHACLPRSPANQSFFPLLTRIESGVNRRRSRGLLLHECGEARHRADDNSSTMSRLRDPTAFVLDTGAAVLGLGAAAQVRREARADDG